jgi:hypothetical protein
MKVFVSGYQSIDMHYIVVPVKCEGGLFISSLRKVYIFRKVPIFSRISSPAISGKKVRP